jgi:hypothetical protein
MPHPFNSYCFLLFFLFLPSFQKWHEYFWPFKHKFTISMFWSDLILHGTIKSVLPSSMFVFFIKNHLCPMYTNLKENGKYTDHVWSIHCHWWKRKWWHAWLSSLVCMHPRHTQILSFHSFFMCLPSKVIERLNVNANLFQAGNKVNQHKILPLIAQP